MWRDWIKFVLSAEIPLKVRKLYKYIIYIQIIYIIDNNDTNSTKYNTLYT